GAGGVSGECGRARSQLISRWSTECAAVREADRLFLGARQAASPLRSAELTAVDAGIVGLGRGGLLKVTYRIADDRAELSDPAVALDRQALCDRRSFRQNAGEFGVSPLRRKIDEAVLVEIGIDKTRQGGERQVESVDRMGDEQRIAGRRLDPP